MVARGRGSGVRQMDETHLKVKEKNSGRRKRNALEKYHLVCSIENAERARQAR